MNQTERATLTNEALLQEIKKSKSTNIFDVVVIGFLIGVAVFSTIKNGFGLITFLPVIYIPVASRNRNKSKALDKLLKERNLK